MYAFNHPYVGTEHFFLAFLKKHKLKTISNNEFRNYLIDIIGYGTLVSDSVLYTPILRDIKNTFSDEFKAVIKILQDEDSIVHSILICKKKDIDKIIEEIRSLE